jgi:hypothetical protein
MKEAKTKYAVIVTGDREWADPDCIYLVLSQYAPGTILIHGDAAGADTVAHQYARSLGLIETRVPYPRFGGRAGGPIRNRVMLMMLLGLRDHGGYTIRVEAFHPDLRASKGTRDMIAQALEADVPVMLNDGSTDAKKLTKIGRR